MARRILLGAVALLVLIQLIRPARTNPPIQAGHALPDALHPPPLVQDVLDRACADCHSHRTVWPWYSQIAPLSWLLARDVNEGRRELNLSEWTQYDAAQASRKLKKSCDEVRSGGMPPWYYLPMHPRAKLEPSEKDAFCRWTEAVRPHA